MSAPMAAEHLVPLVAVIMGSDRLFAWAAAAEDRGLEVIIAGAGGAAHLPGMTAAKTALPVLGVPVSGTLAVGRAGAINAAPLAAAILGGKHPRIREALTRHRATQTAAVPISTRATRRERHRGARGRSVGADAGSGRPSARRDGARLRSRSAAAGSERGPACARHLGRSRPTREVHARPRRILDLLAERYLRDYALVVWTNEVRVLRGDKYS